NGNGQLVEIKNPLNQTRIFNYSTDDLLTSETDESGETREYVYSSLGLLTKEVYPDGSVRHWKPRLGLSLINDLDEVGTIDNPAELSSLETMKGERLSKAGREWKYTTDNFGRILESQDGL